MKDLHGVIIIGPDGVRYRLVKINTVDIHSGTIYPIEADKKIIGDEIRRKREATGLSQEAFAKLVPITQSQLSLIETGESKPQQRTYSAILNTISRVVDSKNSNVG